MGHVLLLEASLTRALMPGIDMSTRQGRDLRTIRRLGKEVLHPRKVLVMIREMIVEVDAIRARLIEAGCKTRINRTVEADPGDSLGIGLELRRDDHRLRRKRAVDRDVNVPFRRPPGNAARDQHVDKAFFRPGRNVHAEAVRVADARRHAVREANLMAPLLLRLQRILLHLPHKVRQARHVHLVKAGLENRRTPEPVELEAVVRIVHQILARHREMIVVDLLLSVVERVVVPLAAPGVAVPGAHAFLVVEPQVAVLGTELHADRRMMDVVHAHRVPHLEPLLVTVLVTVCHELGELLLHVLNGQEHLAIGRFRALLTRHFRNRLAAKRELAVRSDRTVLPVGRPYLRRIERPLEVHVVEDRLHARTRVKVDILLDRSLELVTVQRGELFVTPEVPSVRIDKRDREKKSRKCHADQMLTSKPWSLRNVLSVGMSMMWK